MPVIFQPGYKYLYRQTYTVAIAGALLLGSVVGGSAYAGYSGFKYLRAGLTSDRATQLGHEPSPADPKKRC